MAKKRFTDGLSDLFDQPTFDQQVSDPKETYEGRDMGNDEVSFEVDIPVSKQETKNKISGKGFSGSLDNFLNDSFSQMGANRQRRKTGLDFFIRSTVQPDEESDAAAKANTPDTKRVTLIFRKDHLEELKELAKQREIYLKDLVGEMVSQFLDGKE